MSKDLNIFKPAVSVALVMVWLYVYCSFGQLITSKCEQISDIAYESTFYHYPIDLRIFTLMAIGRAQKPFYITGYKITQCSLHSYRRVSCNQIN